MSGARITATPQARAALEQARAMYGALMFHTSGGRVGGRTYPICLPAKALRLGARDHLVGEVEGVHVYDMEDREGVWMAGADDYILDVEAGPAIGFSISAGPNLRFKMRRVARPDGGQGEGCCNDPAS